MDDIDRANKDIEAYEHFRKMQIRKEEATYTGYCLWCEEPIKEKGRRWCDLHCRDAWEKYRKNKR